MSDNLWEWAVAAYARPGVAEACLDLQDSENQNVPLLLWAAWRPHADEAMARQAAGVAHAWADAVIVPLRQVRRRMKTAVSEGDDRLRLSLREKVKGLELAAEKALLDILGGIHGNGVAPIVDSLRITATVWGAVPPPEKLARLAQALSEG